MPSSEPAPEAPNYRTPSPDAGHEAIRVPLAKAIDELEEAQAELEAHAYGVSDAYFLTDLLFDLLGSALTTIDGLAARVVALESPAVPALEEPPLGE